jgi:hypothetical protein
LSIKATLAFSKLYDESRGHDEARIHDVSSIVPHVYALHHGKRLVRYWNSAHAAANVGLNDTSTCRNFLTRLNAPYAWLTTTTTTTTTVTTIGGTSSSEMERIQAVFGHASMLPGTSPRVS